MKKFFDILSKGFAYAIFLAILIGIDYSFPMAFRTIGLLGTGLVSIATIEWLYAKDSFEKKGESRFAGGPTGS